MIKEELAGEMETTRRDFHHLLDSVPETSYNHPSLNPAWTIGDVLYHITLGPFALRFEIWMICRARWLFQRGLNSVTAGIFNRANALFARRPKQVTRQSLLKSYETGHAGLMSSLKRKEETDFTKSVTYPKSFVAELSGEVNVERLFRYTKGHFDVHAEQIHKALEEKR